MFDASLGLDKKESITIHDYENNICVYIGKNSDGVLSLSIGDGDKDMLQIECSKKLISLSSMTGEDLHSLIKA